MVIEGENGIKPLEASSRVRAICFEAGIGEDLSGVDDAVGGFGEGERN